MPQEEAALFLCLTAQALLESAAVAQWIVKLVSQNETYWRFSLWSAGGGQLQEGTAPWNLLHMRGVLQGKLLMG